MKFKQSLIAWFRFMVAGRNFARSLVDDLGHAVRPVASGAGKPQGASAAFEHPVIFASYATNESLKGSHRYCGGEKLLNNLVLLLRRKGYEAYMVSLDGESSGWLVEHAPFLSVEKFQRRAASGEPVRCVTSWIVAEAYLAHCPRFYFWDQELAASSRSHFPALARAMREGRIVRTAGVNRAVQSFHTAAFDRRAELLRQLVDEKYWRPDESRRVRNRVGYFDEGEHTSRFIDEIRGLTTQRGQHFEFVELRGDEKQIIEQMQGCAIFLALNIGKSPLWGEGGPMSPQEAMACGTVPVCFDMNGPWEIIQQNYNGVVTSRIKPALMAEALANIYAEPGRLERMSRRCVKMTECSHTLEARWPDVCRFLDLPE